MNQSDWLIYLGAHTYQCKKWSCENPHEFEPRSNFKLPHDFQIAAVPFDAFLI